MLASYASSTRSTIINNMWVLEHLAFHYTPPLQYCLSRCTKYKRSILKMCASVHVWQSLQVNQNQINWWFWQTAKLFFHFRYSQKSNSIFFSKRFSLMQWRKFLLCELVCQTSGRLLDRFWRWSKTIWGSTNVQYDVIFWIVRLSYTYTTCTTLCSKYALNTTSQHKL